MTVPGLVTAVVVGLLVAALSWVLSPRRRDVPVWLVLVTGVVTALLGAILARIFGLDLGGFGPWSIVVSAASAIIGVILVIAPAGLQHDETPPYGPQPGFDDFTPTPPVTDRPDLQRRKTP